MRIRMRKTPKERLKIRINKMSMHIFDDVARLREIVNFCGFGLTVVAATRERPLDDFTEEIMSYICLICDFPIFTDCISSSIL